jgi:hypothetical protein
MDNGFRAIGSPFLVEKEHVWPPYPAPLQGVSVDRYHPFRPEPKKW